MSPREKAKNPPRGGDRLIATNRKAYHDYFIDETLEAGIVLVGSEIKSIRAGQVNLRDSYVAIRENEAWMVGAHIDIKTRVRIFENAAQDHILPFLRVGFNCISLKAFLQL